jgi:single-strand DNA-binding protein
MSGYNRIIMLGNLTRDPEFKSLPSGQMVCRLGLACNRQYKAKGEGMTSEVCFVDVDVWGAQAENCHKFLAKGRQILVEGRLKLDTWQDQEGQRRSKHSIVADRVTFIRSQAQDQDEDAVPTLQEAEAPQAAPKKAAAPKTKKAATEEGSFDEELPF